MALLLPEHKLIVPAKAHKPGLTTHRFHDPAVALMAEIAESLGAEMSLSLLAQAYAAQALNGMLSATNPTPATTFYLGINNPTGANNTGANELVYTTYYTIVGSGRPSLAFTYGTTTNSGIGWSNTTQTFALVANITSGSSGTVPFYWSLWTTATTSSTSYICGGATNLTGTVNSGTSLVFTGTGTTGTGIQVSVQG